MSLIPAPIPGSSTSAMMIVYRAKAREEDQRVIDSNGYLVGLLHDV